MPTLPSSADGFVNYSWAADYEYEINILNLLDPQEFTRPHTAYPDPPWKIKCGLLEIVDWDKTQAGSPIDYWDDIWARIEEYEVESSIDTSGATPVVFIQNSVAILFDRWDGPSPVTLMSMAMWWMIDPATDSLQGAWGLLDSPTTVDPLYYPVVLAGDCKMGMTINA